MAGFQQSQLAGAREWKFGQCFGEKDAEEDFMEADLLTAVEFDETGNFLATGDKGGRIVVFERNNTGPPGALGSSAAVDSGPAGGAGSGSGSSSGGSGSAGSGPGRGGAGATGGGYMPTLSCPDYRFYAEFQSHEPEFDYLKSLEIEEKVNQITWCKRMNGSLFLLSTNDKTIKLWKLQERKLKTVAGMNILYGQHGGAAPVSSLRVPQVHSTGQYAVAASTKRVYGTAHSYNINTVSINSDGETFLSADDLRINLWSLENASLSYNLVDIKPPSLEELTEVVTAAEFHPEQCSIFIYSTSKGGIRLADMRAAALCDKQAKLFEEPPDVDPSGKAYFSEITASVSDIEFSRGPGQPYILSRDYLYLKVWDMRMESRPVRSIAVHPALESQGRLVELYESDLIFDRFEVTGAGDGGGVMTGSYSNVCKIYDLNRDTETQLELSRSPEAVPLVVPIGAGEGAGGAGAGGLGGGGAAGAGGLGGGYAMTPPGADITMGGLFGESGGLGGLGGPGGGPADFRRKVLHYTWHPREDIVAISGINNLFIFWASRR